MPNATIVNFAAGETSPRSRGRFDLDWFRASCEKVLNWIPEVSGPARYRSGFRHAAITRGGATARLIPFQINRSQGYQIEFTAGKMRVYKNNALLTVATTTVTAITRAAQGVLTVTSAAALANDDEIIVTGIVGMEELNGRQIKLADKSGSTFKMKDPVSGAYINTTDFGTYVSGGAVGEVYEIDSPYQEAELADIQFTQSSTTMYLAHIRYAPRKLTVIADTFTLTTYTRTNDPFATTVSAVNITDLRPIFVGEARRVGGDATLTPGAVTGAGVTFTASAAKFTSADVGKYIRVVGATRYGFALITGFTSTTVVTATISVDFDATTAIAAGEWQIVTCETQITLASGSVVNTTLNYAIAAVGGATTVNGNTYRLVPFETDDASGAKRYILRTVANVAVDSSAYGVYTSGGTATPSSTQASLTITGITRGVETILTFAAASQINEDSSYLFSGIVGTTELNGQTYYLQAQSDGVHLVTSAGAEVDSSAWTAYVSDGIATLGPECPIAVAFYESRLWFLGTNQRPNSMFGSRAPDDDGNTRYDDFTGGTDDDHACFFALAPVNGQIDAISWGRGTAKYLFVGTFGGPFRVSGSGLDEAITPGSINVRQFDSFGCEAALPAGGSRIFWIQRGGVALRTAYYDVQVDELVTRDMLVNAEHIAESKLVRVVLQSGRPDILWVVRQDGTLAGMTVSGAENVAGWHRQKPGDSGEVLDASVALRTDRDDQLFIVARRTVGGVERCSVEYLADAPTFPDRDDFYTGPDNEEADEERYRNAVWRRQEECIHLDSVATYNGADRGVAAEATLTISDPDAEVDDSVTLSASAAVFRAGDVGKEIWIKPDRDTGEGGGRATITAYTDTTHVTATVDVVFDQTTAAAGDWYFATDTIYGAWHLEGQVVGVVGDGGVVSDGGLSDEEFPQVDVENGVALLPQKVAVAHVGIPYEGVLKSHNLELTDGRGPAQSKPRNISAAFVRFLATMGVEFGTDVYDLVKLDWRGERDKTDRPSPVFSGVKEITNRDGWSRPGETKHVIIRQRLPLPAVVQFVEARYDVSEANA